MSKRITGLIFCSLFFMSVLSADDTNECVKKQYCSAEQIELTDATIFVNLKEGVIEIDSLLVDQGGIYFTEDMKRCVWCRRPLNPKNICECPL